MILHILGPVIVASTQGGMDIEEVAENSPEDIITTPIDLQRGLTKVQAADIAEKLGLFDADNHLKNQAIENMQALYKMFLATDATQVEINPLAITDQAVVSLSSEEKRMEFFHSSRFSSLTSFSN